MFLFLLYCIKSLIDGSLFFTQSVLELSNGTFKTSLATAMKDSNATPATVTQTVFHEVAKAFTADRTNGGV